MLAPSLLASLPLPIAPVDNKATSDQTENSGILTPSMNHSRSCYCTSEKELVMKRQY